MQFQYLATRGQAVTVLFLSWSTGDKTEEKEETSQETEKNIINIDYSPQNQIMSDKNLFHHYHNFIRIFLE